MSIDPTQTVLDASLLPQATSLLAIATSDLDAADALDRQSLHPQAVFALQQGVEKAVKAIGLASRVISVGELQSAISHRAINVFVRGLRKIIAATRAQTARQNEVNQVDGVLKDWESERDRFASVDKPTSDEIARWMKNYRELRDTLGGIMDGPHGPSILESVREGMGDMTGSVDIAELGNRLFAVMTALTGFYFLCLATLGHAIAPRYGDATRTPSEIYSASNALIVHFADLVGMARECVGTTRSSFEFFA